MINYIIIIIITFIIIIIIIQIVRLTMRCLFVYPSQLIRNESDANVVRHVGVEDVDEDELQLDDRCYELCSRQMMNLER